MVGVEFVVVRSAMKEEDCSGVYVSTRVRAWIGGAMKKTKTTVGSRLIDKVGLVVGEWRQVRTEVSESSTRIAVESDEDNGIVVIVVAELVIVEGGRGSREVVESERRR